MRILRLVQQQATSMLASAEGSIRMRYEQDDIDHLEIEWIVICDARDNIIITRYPFKTAFEFGDPCGHFIQRKVECSA